MTLPSFPPSPEGGQPPYAEQPYAQQPYYGQAPGAPVFLPPSTPEGQHPDAPVPVRVIASPWRRLGARVLDFFILVIGAGLLAGLGVALASLTGDLGEPEGSALLLLIVFVSLAVLFMLLYEVITTWKWGGTLGKLAVGVRVVRVADGHSFPSLGLSFGRFGIQLVLRAVPLGGLLDVLWLLWDRPLYQCLHDKVTSTVVIRP
ncbi:Uncharacterized membrane protein YckC, RDD family [Amycolatopsis marina]|uniref:Uncharacterized membrane protein YckC, RDD family n=1 Tax=Amycolatopsis marina TaxID=490629 RepID=A0A1I1A5W5_9PSEU|nr:RDD family protein [Amycolatopsis marina]SFB33424.1 Uncharacterized membrane protein YckC, RDD family [Amycolatopsis marina]